MKKKCHKFIKQLINRLTKDVSGFWSIDDMETALSEATRRLPRCDLKRELKLHGRAYLVKLKRRESKTASPDVLEEPSNEIVLDVVSHSVDQLDPTMSECDHTVPQQDTAVLGQDVSVPLAGVNEQDVPQRNGHLPDNQSWKVKCTNICKLLKSSCPGDSMLTRLDHLTQTPTIKHGANNKATGNRKLSQVQLLFTLTAGSKDPVVLIRVMDYFNWKATEAADKCLTKGKHKQAFKLLVEMQTLLATCHTRMACSKDVDRETHQKYFSHLSSLLSVFIDLHLTHARKLDKKKVEGRSLCGFVTYLLSAEPESVLDVFLCLRILAPEDTEVIMPLIRRTFSDFSQPEDHAVYLKYVLSVKLFQKRLCLPSVEDISESVENCYARQGFLEWLQQLCPAVLEEMPTNDRKFTGRQITRFLCHEADEDLISILLEAILKNTDSEEMVMRRHSQSNSETKLRKDGTRQKEAPVTVTREVEEDELIEKTGSEESGDSDLNGENDSQSFTAVKEFLGNKGTGMEGDENVKDGLPDDDSCDVIPSSHKKQGKFKTSRTIQETCMNEDLEEQINCDIVNSSSSDNEEHSFIPDISSHLKSPVLPKVAVYPVQDHSAETEVSNKKSLTSGVASSDIQQDSKLKGKDLAGKNLRKVTPVKCNEKLVQSSKKSYPNKTITSGKGMSQKKKRSTRHLDSVNIEIVSDSESDGSTAVASDLSPSSEVISSQRRSKKRSGKLPDPVNLQIESDSQSEGDLMMTPKPSANSEMKSHKDGLKRGGKKQHKPVETQAVSQSSAEEALSTGSGVNNEIKSQKHRYKTRRQTQDFADKKVSSISKSGVDVEMPLDSEVGSVSSEVTCKSRQLTSKEERKIQDSVEKTLKVLRSSKNVPLETDNSEEEGHKHKLRNRKHRQDSVENTPTVPHSLRKRKISGMQAVSDSKSVRKRRKV